MPSRGKIDQLFDLPELKKQLKEVVDNIIGQFVKSVDAANQSKIDLKEATKPSEIIAGIEAVSEAQQKQNEIVQSSIAPITEMIEAQKKQNAESQVTVDQIMAQIRGTEDLLEIAVKNEILTRELTAAKKQLNNELKISQKAEEDYKKGVITAADYKKVFLSQEEYESRLGAIKQAQIEVSVSQAEVTRGLKNLEREARSSDGSLDKMKATLALLQQTYSAMSAEEKASPIGVETARQAEELAEVINKQKKGIGDFSSNVGRYSESLSGLFDKVAAEIRRLQGVQTQLTTQYQNLSDADKNSQIGFQLKKNIDGVTASVNQLSNTQQIGFKNGQNFSKTQKQLEKDFKTLATSGLQTDEFLKAYIKLVAESKDQSQDLGDEIKALASDTRGFDLVAGGINTIASGFQLAAGAAALFGANEEDIQRSIQKLVAIQNIATGAREIATELTKRGTLANKAYNLVIQQGTILFGKGATAVQRFGVALKGVAIIAAIGILVDLISRLSDTEDEAKKAEDALSDFNDELERQKRIFDSFASSDEDSYKAKVEAIKKANAARSAAANDDISKLDAETKNKKDLYDADVEYNKQKVTNLQTAETGSQENLLKLQADFQKKYRISFDEAAAIIQQRLADGKKVELTEEIKGDFAIINAQKKNLNELSDLKTKSQYDGIRLDRQIETEAINDAKRKQDELRKLAVDGAAIDLDYITLKNEKILSSEKSTLAERIKAIEALKQAQINNARIKADNSTDPLAERKYNLEVAKINQDALLKTEKEKQTFRLRDLDAVAEYYKFQLEKTANGNEAIFNSDVHSLEERLEAQRKYLAAQKDLADIEFKQKLEHAGYSSDQIALITAGKSKELGLEQTKFDELQAMQIEHETKVLGIISSGGSQTLEIIASDNDKKLALVEKNLNDIQRATADADIDNSIKYSNELIELNKSFQKKKISRSYYESEKIALENKFAAISTANLLAGLRKQVELLGDTNKFELDAKEKLEEERQALTRATTEEEKKAIGERIKLYEQDYDKAKEINDKKKDLLKEIAKAEEEASSRSTKTDDDKTNVLVENINKIRNAYNEVANLIGSFIDAQATAQKNKIQEQLDDIERVSSAQIEAIEKEATTATNTEEKKAARITIINARAQAQKEALAQRQRAIDQRRAIFDKANSIAQIILGTAVSVAKATTIFEKIANAALGAAQLAIAIATPIPKFRFGKKRGAGKDGLGITGDAYRSELIEHEDGSMEVTPSKPTLTFVRKKDIIHPDAKEALKNISNERKKLLKVATNSLHGNNVHFFNSRVERGSDIGSLAGEITSMKHEVVKAIKNIPQTQIQVQNPLSKRIKYGDSTNTYLNNNLQG